MENQNKKRNCRQKEEQDDQKNGMDNLPSEIALDIISRLPITSLIQFRFVCQSWHTLAHDPHLANLHLSRTANDNPYLIFHCDYPIRNQLYFAESFGRDDEFEGIVRKIHTPFSTSMPEFNVIGSCNGLLCLSDSLFNDAIYIYNPFTRNYKELPESTRFQDQQVLFGFGFHPTTNEYKVLKIVYYRNPSNVLWRRRFRNRDNTQSEVQVYSFCSKTWRSIGAVPYQLERRSSEAVLVSGRLHWVSRPGRYNGVRGRIIISFDLANEHFYEVPKPDFGGLRSYNYNYHLAVLGGCLSAAVYCSNGKLEIWVMKDYGVKDSWIKEFNVGAYSSKFLSQDLQRYYGIWKNALSGRIVRVLGLMKNGEILLEYKGGSLALYEPDGGKFRNLVFKGTPKLFQTVLHFGSLKWIDNPVEM